MQKTNDQQRRKEINGHVIMLFWLFVMPSSLSPNIRSWLQHTHIELTHHYEHMNDLGVVIRGIMQKATTVDGVRRSKKHHLCGQNDKMGATIETNC